MLPEGYTVSDDELRDMQARQTPEMRPPAPVDHTPPGKGRQRRIGQVLAAVGLVAMVCGVLSFYWLVLLAGLAILVVGLIMVMRGLMPPASQSPEQSGMNGREKIVRGLVISAVALLLAGLCTITGSSLEEDHLFEAWGSIVRILGLIMLVPAVLGLLYGLGHLAVARGILPRWLLPLFLGVPVVLLGLLAAVYFIYPSSAGHLRLKHAMGQHDFDGLILEQANLRGADLDGIHLVAARLDGADFRGADLNAAILRDAHLAGADLSGANLEGADLTGARVTDDQLAQAASLKGATMPDGSVHE